MTEEEVIALLPIITEQLTGPQFRNDLQQLNFIFIELLGSDKTSAYDALASLQDLLAEISELPDSAAIGAKEWSERLADFSRAAELYLDARWQPPSPTKIQ